MNSKARILFFLLPHLIQCHELDDIYSGIDSRQGTSNILIHVPHSGWISQPLMNERPMAGCYSPSTRTCVYHYSCIKEDETHCFIEKDSDFGSYHFADILQNELTKVLGASPYFIASKIPRAYVDPSAIPSIATFGYSNNTRFYMEYMSKMSEFLGMIKYTHGTGLLLEITHHKYHTKLTMLGYGISFHQIIAMEKGRSTTPSIANIIKRGKGKYEPWEYITGNASLGHFMTKNGFEIVMPSPRYKQSYPSEAQSTSNIIHRFCNPDQPLNAILVSLSQTSPPSNASVHQFALSIKEFLEMSASLTNRLTISYVTLFTALALLTKSL